MTVAETLALAKKIIAPLDAEGLLAYILNLRREELITRDREIVDDKLVKQFSVLVARRAAGEPLAYLTGEKDFFGLTFSVDRRVLIPRPETELIVEEVLAFIAIHPDARTLIDIGTGSGCIPIAIKKNTPHLAVTACDVSPDAITVARGNAERHDVAIDFIQSDLLADVPHAYDIVTANLPYVELGDGALAPDVAAYEPHLALFGGADGLDLYRRLLTQIAAWEAAPRLTLFECAPWQTEPLAALARQAFPRHTVTILPDLAGQERVVRCTVE